MHALVNMPIWNHTHHQTHMQKLYIYIYRLTLKSISDSSHLEERTDIRPSGEESGAAESLPHISLTESITDNLTSVIQST